METHLQDILYAIGTIVPLMAFIWQINKSQMDKLDKRFDAIEARLARIEQNHLEHLMTLHAIPVSPPESMDKGQRD